LFRQQRVRYRVLDRNTLNMDEYGLCISEINPRRAVGKIRDEWGRPCERTNMRNKQDRQWMSTVECISAGATCTRPLVIFEGVNVNINWTWVIHHRISILLILLLAISLYSGYKRYAYHKQGLPETSTEFYFSTTITHTYQIVSRSNAEGEELNDPATCTYIRCVTTPRFNHVLANRRET
jgi:hypothetical protein